MCVGVCACVRIRSIITIVRVARCIPVFTGEGEGEGEGGEGEGEGVKGEGGEGEGVKR